MSNKTTSATPVPSAEAQEGRQPYLEIIARLETATEGSRELDRLVHNARGDRPTISAEELAEDDRLESFIAPCTTSIDAALTLLPPSAWFFFGAGKTHPDEPLYGAMILQPGDPDAEDIGSGQHPASLPIAICIACLRAKASPATVAADNGTPPNTDETKGGTP